MFLQRLKKKNVQIEHNVGLGHVLAQKRDHS